MIDGHGDDAYKYGQKIRINFSSNVYNHVNHNGLREHLYHRMESIRSYPEPEPYSLEQALAHSLHLSDGKEVCVPSITWCRPRPMTAICWIWITLN